MSSKTKIEWTDSTWTPIRARNRDGFVPNGERRAIGKIGWHCEHASEGCRNCYAESINRRLGTGLDFKPGHRKDIEIFLDEKMLLAPLRWKKPRTIFVCSMTDLFADFVKDEWIDRVFAVMARCPQHKFQVLTKRALRMREYFALAERWKQVCAAVPTSFIHWPLPNTWLGVSAEDQARADERIPELLQTPAALRFVSLEPLLGAIDLNKLQTAHPRIFVDAVGGARWVGEWEECPKLDWVIVGGESGPHARPMHPDWARSIRDQCHAAGVPFFMKQWGEWQPGDGDCVGQQFYRVGKKASGRLLDGKLYDGMPG